MYKFTSRNVLIIILLYFKIQESFLPCMGLVARNTGIKKVQTISLITSDEEEVDTSPSVTQSAANSKLPQLNCIKDPTICGKVCNEKEDLPYTATFCSPVTGSCVCDCRDKLKNDCVQTPFTPCFQDCVTANPNPDLFLYRGGNCPITTGNGTVAYQCACECSVREKEYFENNDIS